MRRKRNGFLTAALLAMLAGSASSSPNLDVYKSCGLTGTAKSTCGKALNRLKNRYASPASQSINPKITLAAILAPGDDATRWKTSDAAQITGFVATVQPGGLQESCNCGKPNLRDIHIDVMADLADASRLTRHVIVEITPRMRSLHPSWTLSWAEKLRGKRVRLTGWMLYDGMHSRESFNTKDEPHQACGDLKVVEIWRATAWEIHPVTGIQIL